MTARNAYGEVEIWIRSSISVITSIRVAKSSHSYHHSPPLGGTANWDCSVECSCLNVQPVYEREIRGEGKASCICLDEANSTMRRLDSALGVIPNF